MLVKLIRAVFVLPLVFLLSCGSPETSRQEASRPSDAYVGTWKRVSGKNKSLTIYEKDGGLFLQYQNGSTYPLKFESEGRYYSAHTPLGDVPLLLDKGIMTINNGYAFRYQRVSQ